MSSKTQKIGTEAEDIALNYLFLQGLKLIDRNFNCQQGEIDLIMQDQDQYVFIEVRYRKNPYYGDPLESVTSSKKAKIIKAATIYLLQQELYDKVVCRFDVISVVANQSKISWIKDAFQVQ